MITKEVPNEEFVRKLQGYGLSKHEASLYIAALSSGAVGMSELARRAGIKRPTAYLAFRSLVTKGSHEHLQKHERLQIHRFAP